MRAHQPGSEPIDIPETIPNPVLLRPNPLPRSQFGSRRSGVSAAGCNGSHRAAADAFAAS